MVSLAILFCFRRQKANRWLYALIIQFMGNRSITCFSIELLNLVRFYAMIFLDQ